MVDTSRERGATPAHTPAPPFGQCPGLLTAQVQMQVSSMASDVVAVRWIDGWRVNLRLHGPSFDFAAHMTPEQADALAAELRTYAAAARGEHESQLPEGALMVLTRSALKGAPVCPTAPLHEGGQ